MKHITEEQIETVVNEAFVKANENIAIRFANNLKELCDKVESKEATGSLPYFAAINIVQQNYMDVIKTSLKKLLCD